MGQPSPPKPNPSGDYAKSLKTYLQFLPQLLSGEQAARGTYDPQRLNEQFNLQDLYGGRQSQQQLQALQRLDPQGVAIRQQLGQNVSSDLASGYKLPPGLETQLNSQIRGAEAARGNVLGAAPITAEALYKGNAMQQLYQQHLQNAGNFLAGPTPEQQLLTVQPVTPDRSSQYVNPSAPGQLAAPNYQNMLAAWQASSGQRAATGSAWGTGIGATLGGVIGGIYGGPGGTQLGVSTGGAAGGAVGGYFSDERLKENIVAVGFSERRYPIYEFNYKDCSGRFRGTIAQSILPLKPSAVSMDATGFWKVDYDQLDIKLEQIPDLVEA